MSERMRNAYRLRNTNYGDTRVLPSQLGWKLESEDMRSEVGLCRLPSSSGLFRPVGQ